MIINIGYHLWMAPIRILMFEKIDISEDVMSISDFNIMVQETYPQFNTIIDL